MRKIIIGFLSVLLALAAAATVIWPAYGELESAHREEERAFQLARILETIDPELSHKHRNLAMWYNLAIQSETTYREAQSAYWGILDLGNRAMGILELPTIGVSWPIYHGGGRETGGIVHRPDSSLPVGGRGNHTVLEIRDTYTRQTLEKLELGEMIRIRTPGGTLVYRVDETGSIIGNEPPELIAVEGEDLCTLVIYQGRERIYLRCSRVEAEPGTRETPGNFKNHAVYTAIAAAAAAGIMPWMLGLIPSLLRGKRRAKPAWKW